MVGDKKKLQNWIKFYYYLNYLLYLFERIESFIYSLIIAFTIKSVYINNRVVLPILFSISIIFIIWFVRNELNKFLTTYLLKICLGYLSINPLLVVSNTNKNYNETIRLLFYQTHKEMVDKVRQIDIFWGDNLIQLAEPLLRYVHAKTGMSLYEMIFRNVFFEDAYFAFLQGRFKQQKKTLLREIYAISISNYEQNNLNHIPTLHA